MATGALSLACGIVKDNSLFLSLGISIPVCFGAALLGLYVAEREKITPLFRTGPKTEKVLYIIICTGLLVFSAYLAYYFICH